jgi:outer membrane protein assembly factor BamB
VVWGDQLVRQARFTPLASLSDIRGRPVIDRGRVFAISYSGRLAAIDLRTGERVWERDVAGAEAPWVAGDFIFLVTIQAEVVCLSRADGRIRWVTQLQQYENEKRKEDPVLWSGPVLVSDRLVLASSHGEAVSISPYSGEVLGQIRLPDGVTIAPIVADGAMVLYTDDAELIALR